MKAIEIAATWNAKKGRVETADGIWIRKPDAAEKAKGQTGYVMYFNEGTVRGPIMFLQPGEGDEFKFNTGVKSKAAGNYWEMTQVKTGNGTRDVQLLKYSNVAERAAALDG